MPLAFGRRRKRRSSARQIGRLVERSDTQFGGAPTLIGENGIAMNLNGGQAYRTGDFSAQIAALDDTMQALEANLISAALWDYTADNTNARGDGWNGEDLSIFSRDQQSGAGGLDDGGRALAAAVRPYASKVPGQPLRMQFDINTGAFDFEFHHDPGVPLPAEIFARDPVSRRPRRGGSGRAVRDGCGGPAAAVLY